MGLIYTNRYTEVEELGAGTLHADSRAAGTYNTTWTPMHNFQRAIALLDVGEMQAGATLDLAFQQASDNTGTGAKAFTPAKAITQLTQAGGDGNDVVIIEIRTEEMDVNNQFDHVRAQLIVAGAAVECTLMVWKHVANYPPVSITGLTEVVD
jgi:hypothetical protein